MAIDRSLGQRWVWRSGWKPCRKRRRSFCTIWNHLLSTGLRIKSFWKVWISIRLILETESTLQMETCYLHRTMLEICTNNVNKQTKRMIREQKTLTMMKLM